MTFSRPKLARALIWLIFVDLLGPSPANGFSIPNEDSDGPSDNAPHDEPSYHCLHFSSNKQLSTLDYSRFGSKTTYLNVRDQLRHTFNMTWPFNPRDCYPVYLFLIVRHSIQYPTAMEMSNFQSATDTVKTLLPGSNKMNDVMKADLSTWQLLMHPSEANRVSMAGNFETSVFARIFYKYFPTLLNISKNEFEVGVSPIIQATETAEAFLRGLIEFQMRTDTATYEESNYMVENVLRLKFAMKVNSKLLAHDQVKQMIGPQRKYSGAYNQLVESAPFQKLVHQFREWYGLPEVDFDMVRSLWRLCMFEVANIQHSPWCALFNKEQALALEYLQDSVYYEEAYGNEVFRQLGCTIILELYNKLVAIVEQKGPLKNSLYFTHEDPIKRLASFLGLFEDFPPHIVDEEGGLCLPLDRAWHSAYVIPFNGNFAAGLYQCGSNNKYQLFTMFNEIPVKIAGCDSSLCDLDQFLAHFEGLRDTCNLNTILS